MASFASLLTAVSTAVLSKGGKTVLTGLGIGIFTSTVTLTLMNKYIQYAQSSYSALGDVSGILALAGFDKAFSIVFSAMVIKMTMRSKLLSFKKLS